MSESYEVVTAALAGHARTLDELTADLRQALETAGVKLTGDAYGHIGQSFVAAAESLARTGRNALRSEVDATESAATAMRATVTEYERQDGDGLTRLAAVADELGREVPEPHRATGSASTSDTTTIPTAASVRSPEPVRLASLDAATMAAVTPDTPAAPPASGIPSLRPLWGFTATPPGSGPPSTSSFPGMNRTDQNRVRAQVRNGVRPAPGAERISADNIEAALTQGPERAIPLYSPVGTAANPLPAIRFSSADLATRPDLIRGMMSLDPAATGVNAQWPELRGGLEALARSWNGPREMWVQVPAGSSVESVRDMVERAGNGVQGVENLTVVVRDPAGNVLGTATRPPFP